MDVCLKQQTLFIIIIINVENNHIKKDLIAGITIIVLYKGVFKKFSVSDRKRKKKKGCWGGGGYLSTYFWGLYFFEWG